MLFLQRKECHIVFSKYYHKKKKKKKRDCEEDKDKKQRQRDNNIIKPFRLSTR